MRHGDSLMEGRKIRTMKTNSFLTTIFVLEKTRKRTQRVNAFLKASGPESKAEVVSITDLVTESALSQG
jgi:hypothetical protein